MLQERLDITSFLNKYQRNGKRLLYKEVVGTGTGQPFWKVVREAAVMHGDAASDLVSVLITLSIHFYV